jgi:predicted nucleic acid-binding Zn ribbon protein
MSRQIGTAIESVLKQLGLGQRLQEFEILDMWSSIVGERISKVTHAEHIREGKLYVHVTHATWRNELVYLKKDIIDKINKTTRKNIVKDIIFH